MAYLPALHTPEEDLAYFCAQLRERECQVAVQDDNAVGFAIFGDGWLHHLYVDPAWQSRGIGTALLSAAKSRSEIGLQLWAFQANTGARRFYERHAFVVVEETDGSGNEERVPDVRYRWDAVDSRGAR